MNQPKIKIKNQERRAAKRTRKIQPRIQPQVAHEIQAIIATLFHDGGHGAERLWNQ